MTVCVRQVGHVIARTCRVGRSMLLRALLASGVALGDAEMMHYSLPSQVMEIPSC